MLQWLRASLVLIAQPVTGGGQAVVNQTGHTEPQDAVLARAALVLLRAAAREAPERGPIRYVFDESQPSVDLEGAVRILATANKPVDCAGAFVGDTLMLVCRPYTAPAVVLQAMAQDLTKWVFDKVEKDFRLPRDTRVLLI